jgi:hypothetical protein
MGMVEGRGHHFVNHINHGIRIFQMYRMSGVLNFDCFAVR